MYKLYIVINNNIPIITLYKLKSYYMLAIITVIMCDLSFVMLKRTLSVSNYQATPLDLKPILRLYDATQTPYLQRV